MENYARYENISPEAYDKKDIMTYLVRLPSDKKIFPLISKIENKKILDVGVGTGYYTKILMQKNFVAGVDQNPHLCNLAIKLYKGDAADLTRLVQSEKFDIVFSTWMTEYLSPEQLEKFFAESKRVLNNNGRLITTVISAYGWGFVYITLARVLKGISKYGYRTKQVIEKLKEAGFTDIRIITLNARLFLPWAYLVIAK